MHNIANIHFKQKKYQEAFTYFEKSIYYVKIDWQEIRHKYVKYFIPEKVILTDETYKALS